MNKPMNYCSHDAIGSLLVNLMSLKNLYVYIKLIRFVGVVTFLRTFPNARSGE